MRVAVAGIPGAWSSEHLASSLQACGVDSFVFSPADLVHDIVTGDVSWQEIDLSSLDGIAVKKLGEQSSPALRLRLHPLRALEARGVRVFSPPEMIDRAMDRMRMTMILASAGLPLPRTFGVWSDAGVDVAVAALGDTVVKPVYTSKGRGMVRRAAMAKAGDAVPVAAASIETSLVQQFVPAPGRDIGATVIGGTFVGAFYRVARSGEWMTTTDRGGVYAPCELDATGIAYAERAAAAFALDYTVVDLVEHEGGYLLYEVSAFGGFRGLLEASGVDAGALYAQHIVKTLEGS